MTESEIIIDFVKTFYFLTFKKDGEGMKIFIHDSLEPKETKKVYWIGNIFSSEIYFVWDKAEQMTGINIHSKENSSAMKHLFKCLKCTQTISFIKFVIDSVTKEDKKFSFYINDIQEEFPLLFANDEIQSPVEMS